MTDREEEEEEKPKETSLIVWRYTGLFHKMPLGGLPPLMQSWALCSE